MNKTLQHDGYITSIPLIITCTLNGARTDGVLVAVMQDDLDRLTSALAAAEARVKVLEHVVDVVRQWQVMRLRRLAAQAALSDDTEGRSFQEHLDTIDRAWEQEFRAAEELADALTALDDQQDMARLLGEEAGE